MTTICRLISFAVMVVSGANFKYQAGPSNEFVTGNLDSVAKSSNTTSQFASSFISQSDWSGVQEEGNLQFNVKMVPGKGLVFPYQSMERCTQ